MIETRDVSFSYTGGTSAGGTGAGGPEVLKELTFTLNEGECVGLVGSNGSGKSTLLRIIMGLERPDSGEVFLFGNKCSDEEDFEIARRRIGFLFQLSEDQLFCPTVEEDISFGPLNLGLSHEEARERVEEVSKMLGINGLKRNVTHKLSGGQKRLVALATAASMHPDVFILDEPTAGLDDDGMQTLLEFISSHVSTCIITSHDREFLNRVTSRVFLLKGM
jgi:cobalt/nickel transport system ATP-binding protein